MSLMRPHILCLAFGALLAGSHSAVAQYYYYPPYSAYPSGGGYPGDQQRGYGGPSRDDYDYEPSRRPRAGRDYDGDLDNEQRPTPSNRLHPRGKARVAALPADADPNYSTPTDYDDEVDPETTASLVDDPTGERSGAITIEYRQYGVKLSVEPYVMSDNRIVLKLAPEVSELDYTNRVQIQGFNIPGFRRRSASTTVELGDGQSFIIAGLTFASSAQNESKAPLLGDLPVLGTFFKTAQNSREKLELDAGRLREEAISMLKLASAMDGRSLQAITHSHRHGDDLHVVWDKGVVDDEAACDIIRARSSYEPDFGGTVVVTTISLDQLADVGDDMALSEPDPTPQERG